MQGLNVLLRFAWLQTVLDFQFSFLHTQGLITIVASLEIIRRGIWNFFRYDYDNSIILGSFLELPAKNIQLFWKPQMVS